MKKAVNKIVKTHTKKLERLTRNTVLPFTSNEMITNLWSCDLTSQQLEVLKYELTHSICLPRINKSDVFTCFELINGTMIKHLKDRKEKGKVVADLSHIANSYILTHRPTVADLKKYKVLKDLRRNPNIMILNPDKGNGVVILDRSDYDTGVLKIISDSTKFKPIKEDPTLLRESQLQRFLRKLKTNGHLDPKVYSKIYPSGSQPARIYGLPKMHKPRGPNSLPPFRPIVSSIGTYNCELAKYLCSLLQPYIPSNYCTQDSFTFVKEIQDIPLSGNFMVSFDVESLFTNIPLDECIDIVVRFVKEDKTDIKLSATELKTLSCFATAQTHFLFKGSFYDQLDGGSTGSPLAPVLANLFVGHNEKDWIENYKGSKILFYRRYVDDTFCVCEREQDAVFFYNYINS